MTVGEKATLLDAMGSPEGLASTGDSKKIPIHKYGKRFTITELDLTEALSA